MIQQTNHSLQRQVEQLQQQLSQQSLKPPQSPPQAQVRGRQLQERESRKQLPVQPSLESNDEAKLTPAAEFILEGQDNYKILRLMSLGTVALHFFNTFIILVAMAVIIFVISNLSTMSCHCNN